MLSNVLIVAAAAVFSMALRSYGHPVLRRLGTIGIFFTSFLAGWLIGGHLLLGVFFAATWLFLPWLEILTRVRTLRLPIERRIEERPPPTLAEFPDFSSLTDEVEQAGFEHVADLGWDHEEQRQFFRVFYQDKSATEAAICLVEQNEVTFYYISITSRDSTGEVYQTWNYPFSYGLRLQPRFKIQRVPSGQSFEAMLGDHRYFLENCRVGIEQSTPHTPDSIRQLLESDMRAQIIHNIDCGLLKREGPDTIRYSLRGMIFLWFQFLRDLVRLS